MNLLNKGVKVLLLAGLIIGCVNDDDDYRPATSVGTGITKVILSSFEAVVSGDGTVVTVTPLSVGADSYEVDFGDDTSTSDVLTITEQNGSITYDYPNLLETVDYTISVVGKSNGSTEDSDVQTEVLEITHTPATLTTISTSPSAADLDVLSIFSDGIETDGVFTAYSQTVDADFEAGTAQYSLVEVGDDLNNAIQYSRLRGTTTGTIAFDSSIVVADAFGAGQSADSLHIDLHSIHNIGVDKVKISLGGKTYEQDLVSDEWTAFDLDLADEGITTIDDIVFEVGTNGTANDEATLNIDNVYLHRVALSIPDFTFDDDDTDYSVTFTDASELATTYSWDFGDGSGTSTEANPTYVYADGGMEATYTVTLTTTNWLGKTTSVSYDVTVGVVPTGPVNPVIVKGDFEVNESATSNAWKIANSASGNSNPFGRSSDGSCTNYEGVATGSKTRGAKWSGSQGAADIDGAPVAGNTRYAYQAVNLTPNTDYVFEYEYAIRTGGSADNRVVGLILNGHFDDSDVALASNPLIKHVGMVANGKFGDNSCSGGTLVQETFRSNSVGEIAIFFYTFNDKDSYIDNVKIYVKE